MTHILCWSFQNLRRHFQRTYFFLLLEFLSEFFLPFPVVFLFPFFQLLRAMRKDTPSSISASLTRFTTVNINRFENTFYLQKITCSISIQHLLSYQGASKMYFSYLLHNLQEPFVTPGGEGLYRSCTGGCIVEDTSFEVDCILPEEPVRVSRGVGRTSQLEVQSQNYAGVFFSFTVKRQQT